MGVFDRLGVTHVVHCGDIVGTNVLDQLVGRACTFVWGNMDRPEEGFETYAEAMGLRVPESVPAMLRLAGKTLAVFHGHEPGFKAACRHLDVDYILHGHTHQPRDERLDGKRIINPGALYRVRQRTVAVLDLATDQLTFHELPD